MKPGTVNAPYGLPAVAGHCTWPVRQSGLLKAPSSQSQSHPKMKLPGWIGGGQEFVLFCWKPSLEMMNDTVDSTIACLLSILVLLKSKSVFVRDSSIFSMNCTIFTELFLRIKSHPQILVQGESKAGTLSTFPCSLQLICGTGAMIGSSAFCYICVLSCS